MIEAQAPRPAGLRIAVVGGGCSGFSYSMNFENNPGMLDKAYDSDGFKVFVDQATSCTWMALKWTSWTRSKALASSSTTLR
jgi:Fe-S cluster assembly iron-binding protein IscA